MTSVVAEANPDDADTQITMAYYAYDVGLVDQAEGLLAKAHTTLGEGNLPSYSQACVYALWARISLTRGQPVDAVQLAEKMLSLCPDLPNVRITYWAIKLAAASDTEEASDAACELEALYGSVPRSWYAARMLARHYEDLGETQKALEFYERALQDRPHDAPLKAKVESFGEQCLP